MLDFPSTGLVANVTTYTGPSGQEWLWDGRKWLAAGETVFATIAQLNASISAALASFSPPSTGTGLYVRQSSPTINTPSITGITNGSNAAAGIVGEFFEASTTTGAATLNLTAGDWQVLGNFIGVGTGNLTNVTFEFRQAGTLITRVGSNARVSYVGAAGITQFHWAMPPVRVNLLATTVISINVTTLTPAPITNQTVYICARRVR